MAAVEESIEISRPPEDVFAYATDFARYPEWQGSVVAAHWDGDTSPGLGAKAIVTRRIGRRESTETAEITQWDPPRSWAVRSPGRVVGIARGTILPLAGGARSRVTIGLDFEGRGIGRLLIPLVVLRQARKQLPRNQQRLKELVERQARRARQSGAETRRDPRSGALGQSGGS